MYNWKKLLITLRHINNWHRPNIPRKNQKVDSRNTIPDYTVILQIQFFLPKSTFYEFFSEVNLKTLHHITCWIRYCPRREVGRISYDHCLYHASPFCPITCILFLQSIFLHLILY